MLMLRSLVTGLFHSIRGFILKIQGICLASVSFAVLVMGGTAVAQGKSAYYRVPLDGIEVTKGKMPDRIWARTFDSGPAASPEVRVTLKGPGEAYLLGQDNDGWPRWHKDNTALVLRTPEPREVQGRLYISVAKDRRLGVPTDRETRIIHFTVPRNQAEAAARPAFYRGMRRHFARLLAADVPGAAWFRHRKREAEQALKEEGEPVGSQPLARGLRRGAGDGSELFAMFTGGRAVSENLQLDRLMPETDEQSAKQIKTSEIEGITVEPYEFDLENPEQIEIDPLAKAVPHDQHAMFFPTFEGLMKVKDQIAAHDTLVLRLAEPRSVDLQLAKRYEKQLCLPVSAVARTVGPHAVNSVAITGSDPYLPTGSDLAVLFRAKSSKLLYSFIRARQKQAASDQGNVEEVSGDYNGVEYEGVRSTSRRISSYVAPLDSKNVVVTNSLHQLKQVIDTAHGPTRALAKSDDYRFFRQRYPRGEGKETALLVVPDAAIRRWCGPKWRVGAARRLRAAAVLGELHARHLDPLVKQTVEPGPIHTTFDIPGGLGDLRLTSAGVRSSRYGSLRFLTPVAELDLKQMTAAEAERYRQWRDGYQRNWNQMYDPIGMRLHLGPEGLTSDLTVKPLITGSDFRQFINLTRGGAIEPGDADRHAETLAHFAMALDRESRQIQMGANFAQQMARDLGADPLAWLGDTVAVYIEDGPFWEDLVSFIKTSREMDPPKRTSEIQDFVQKNFHRIPIAVHVEVSNGMKLTAFLASVRAFINQTSPGMVTWQNHTHNEQQYVEVGPSAQAVADAPDLEGMSIYYAPSAKALMLSPSESLLKRALDRQAKQRQANTQSADEDGDKANADKTSLPPWLGRHMALHVDRKVAKLVGDIAEPQLRRAMQRRAWGSLPILNTWKRRYPDREPTAIHARVWGQQLIDPGGGKYAWQAKYETMGSTTYGHPMEAQEGDVLPPALMQYRFGNFGLTFEEQGLRARVRLLREKQ